MQATIAWQISNLVSCSRSGWQATIAEVAAALVRLAELSAVAHGHRSGHQTHYPRQAAALAALVAARCSSMSFNQTADCLWACAKLSYRPLPALSAALQQRVLLTSREPLPPGTLLEECIAIVFLSKRAAELPVP